ncbi:MAG: hypothetical protein JWO05_2096 [Gemmatimonadetes bacterium]|nr:hypothetical protein [Gemmatimonadota bacterium]
MADQLRSSQEPSEDFGDEGGGGLSVRELTAILARRWWVVAAVLAAVVSVSAWRTARQPRLYQATATVKLQPRTSILPGMAGSQARLDYRIDPLLSEQNIMKSKNVSDRVARTLGLRVQIVQPAELRRSDLFGSYTPSVADAATEGDRLVRFDNAGFSVTAGSVNYGHAKFGDTLDVGGAKLSFAGRPAGSRDQVLLAVVPLQLASAIVRNDITTHVVPSTDLIEITYTGPDRIGVRDLANTIAKTYRDFSSEGDKTNAVSKTSFIASSLKEQEAALTRAQDDLRHFKEVHETGDVTDEAKALFTNVQEFEKQRRDLENERQVYATLMGKVAAADTADEELRRLAATEVMVRNAALNAKYARWQELVKQRQELFLGGTVTHNNPDVQRLDRAITDTKAELREQTGLYLRALETRLAQLDNSVAAMKSQSKAFPPLEAEQARLLANVETAQKMYNDLMSQHQLSRIAQSADGDAVRLIDEAVAPNFAVSPNRKRAFLLSLILGLLLGVGLAVLLERLDDSVRSPLDLSDKLQLPVLGMIPAIRAGELTSGGAAATTSLSRIVTHADPRSPVAEAYRSLRTNLAFARSQRDVRSMVLTSPGPADGKSTTVANLAITFAQQGQRTLLVDADLRRAVLDKTFRVPRSPGLTDVIIGDHTLKESVHQTEVPNLFVMGSGPLPPNPSELLGSPAMRRVIEQATTDFDIVLFDSPPLLAVTDAAVLSTMVDGSLLVARVGATQRRALSRALSQLRAVHGRILGGVLNDVTAAVSAYYGGYGYYYYYSSGNEAPTGPPPSVFARLRKLAGVK